MTTPAHTGAGRKEDFMDESKIPDMTYKVIGWTWWSDSDYISAPLTDEVIEAVAEEIREHGYCFGGDSHQRRDGCVPVLSTGQAVRCSMREWGSVMAWAYFGKHFSLDYMGWYMDCCIQDDALCYPEEGVDESLFTHPHYFKFGITHGRFKELLKEKKTVDVLATFDEPTNMDVSDIGLFWDYSGKSYDQIFARITKITRFDSPQDFIASDLFGETDLAGLEGNALLEAINSTRDHVPVARDEGITVCHYEYVDLIPDGK